MFDFKIIATNEHPMPDEIFRDLMNLNSKKMLSFPDTKFYKDKIIYEEEYMGIYKDHVFSKNNLVVGVSIDKEQNEFILGIGTGCMMIDYIDINDENKKILDDFYLKIKQLTKTMPQNYF